MTTHVIVSDAAPSEAPPAVGIHYIHTQLSGPGVMYFAAGTSDVTDWVQVGGGGGSPYTANQRTVDSGTIWVVSSDAEYQQITNSGQVNFGIDVSNPGTNPFGGEVGRLVMYVADDFGGASNNGVVANGGSGSITWEGGTAPPATWPAFSVIEMETLDNGSNWFASYREYS